tara:strand:+ start:301 stop:2004 length:1704 start_codon:yes stop_codon:yes gene_type:complete
MALTKLPSGGLGSNSVTTGKINTSAVTEAKIASNAVTAGKITDGTVAAADLASTLDLSSKTLTLPDASFNNQFFNVALLGFKMAVNDSLTVFNLVDGVVDEFHDESGTDEGEGSNDLYNSSDDYYINSTRPDGSPLTYSAGFTMTTVTEADTSTAGTNPAQGGGSTGTFTVPTGITSVSATVIGAGGARAGALNASGGGGGAVKGNLAVTASQTLHISAGEGGDIGNGYAFFGGGYFASGSHGGGGGNAGIFAGAVSGTAPQVTPAAGGEDITAPQVYLIAGAGGGAGNNAAGDNNRGGSGGGLVGDAGYNTINDSTFTEGNIEQTNKTSEGGGGGDQEQGGQGQPGADSGTFLTGGPSGGAGAGGAGYYGGGGGNPSPSNEAGAGGGGSSFIGHPQITSGSTEEGADQNTGAAAFPEYPGINDPLPYSVGVGNGGPSPGTPKTNFGGDGFVLLTAAAPATATSTTIVSNAFTATSAPSTSRIVVFQENIDTPTLNTDIIASVSRDGGSNFSTVTLVDEGYVTGASGQRILAGLVDVSGQPSGTSLRWKLALANNQSKIHGVSLSWA